MSWLSDYEGCVVDVLAVALSDLFGEVDALVLGFVHEIIFEVFRASGEVEYPD